MINFTNPKDILNNTNLLNHFLDLVKLDTQSSEDSTTVPSTQGQLVAMQVVCEKLKAIGLSDAHVDEHGYLYATLPANTDNTKSKTIGLIAHIDTAQEFSGKNVKPQLHHDYDGKAITLNNGVVISPDENPELIEFKGQTIITADGTTLLGSDDKSGVAEILATLEFLLKHPEVRRPNIKIGITPDEEIGRGANHFDIKKFNADCAYTLDGGLPGEINEETFNAFKADITFTGVSVHPGTAKNKMVNALRYATKFIDRLPQDKTPETTDNREGFIHPLQIKGDASTCQLSLILRDFEHDNIQEQIKMLNNIKTTILKEETRLVIQIDCTESYKNMGVYLKQKPEVFNKLKLAVTNAGLKPHIMPIRGGTDGSRLTEMGLLTPNIFSGGNNHHGPKEWVSTRAQALAVCVTLNLLQAWTE